MKPKRNYKPGTPDECYTPGYALESLLPYLPKNLKIWECASGKGYLVRALESNGYTVTASTIESGQDFFEYEPSEAWDCIVTNPPFSLKTDWIARCLEFDKPFALLLPSETISLGGVHALVKDLRPCLGVVWHSPRINFYMPEKGWTGNGAQFPTAWFTYGLPLVGNAISPMPHWTRAYQRTFEE